MLPRSFPRHAGVSFEQIVRPFQRPETTPPPARRSPVESDGDLAILTWGGEIDLTADSGGFSIVNPGSSQPTSPTETRKTVTYSEVSRATKVVRVFNDQDNSQWVDVERITSITFRGSDDREVVFNLSST